MRIWVAFLLVVVVGFRNGVSSARAEDTGMSLEDAIRGYESSSHASFRGVPEDWSTHHVVFSHPEVGSAAESKVPQDPRYWLRPARAQRQFRRPFK
jgi:hypothetical protein